MLEINVTYGGSTIVLPVNENNNITLENLRMYFHQAEGLTYKKDGKTHGLRTVLGEIVLNPDIKDYDVFTSNVEDPLKNCNENKRKRINEIMSKLQNKTTTTTESKENAQGGRAKMQKLNPHKAMKLKQKKINVGWMHREDSNEKYRQIKSPLGGLIILSLDEVTEYSVKDIIKMTEEEFSKKETVADILKTCTISLGMFDGVELDFTNENGESTHLWEFLKVKSLSAHRVRLYLLSTNKSTKEQEEDEIKNTKTEDEVESTKADDEVEKSNASNSEYSNIEYLDENFAYDSDFEKYEDVAQKDVNQVSDAADLQKYEIKPNVEDKSEENAVKLTDTIEILYQHVTISKYSKYSSFIEVNRDDAYYQVWLNMKDASPREEEFNPVDYGYDISRVVVNGQTLVQIDVNDDLSRTFTFPFADLTSKNNHDILYNDSILNGYCQGRYGVGVIPFCTDDTCRCIISYRKNGNLVKSGRLLYWFDSPELVSDHGASWSINIQHINKE